MDYFHTNIMPESEQYEGYREPTIEEIEARNREIELMLGDQTETHCSGTSSMGACQKLNRESERCTLFKKKLEHDFKAHAYKRCGKCIEAEISTNEKE